MAIELQGRTFRAGDLVKSILMMCGGHFNSFYLHAQKMAIAEVLYLLDHWVEVQKQMNSPKK